MILVRKNVYKDACLFENVFNVYKIFGNVCENSKDSCLEIEQVTRSNLPTQMSFLCIFYSFDIVVLPLICQATLTLDVNETGVGHRITMISNVARYLSIFF